MTISRYPASSEVPVKGVQGVTLSEAKGLVELGGLTPDAESALADSA